MLMLFFPSNGGDDATLSSVRYRSSVTLSDCPSETALASEKLIHELANI